MEYLWTIPAGFLTAKMFRNAEPEEKHELHAREDREKGLVDGLCRPGSGFRDWSDESVEQFIKLNSVGQHNAIRLRACRKEQRWDSSRHGGDAVAPQASSSQGSQGASES